MDHKTVRVPVELKAGEGAEPGTVVAQIATLNVVDRDGDVTLPGAFDPKAHQRISLYNHSSAGMFGSRLPVGIGSIEEAGDKVIFTGQINLALADGQELHKALQFDAMHGTPSEWSYGFRILEAGEGEHEDQKVRFLKQLDVFEVSPVILGAGIGTETVAVKSGTPITEHAAAVESTLAGFVERVEARAKARAAEGRPLSFQNRVTLRAMVESVSALKASIEAALESDVVTPEMRAFAMFQHSEHEIEELFRDGS